MRRLAAEFNQAGREWDKAKSFTKCVNIPLPGGPDEREVLICIPPPELHLHLRVINHLFDEQNKNGINRVNYQGCKMAGNDCNKLLQKSRQLLDDLPDELKQFALCLYHFDCMREACFSVQLDSNFLAKIGTFKKSYLVLNVSVTPKVYAVFQLVGEFCTLTGKALDPFSSQQTSGSTQ